MRHSRGDEECHLRPRYDWESHGYVQITWRGKPPFYERKGWGHEENWLRDLIVPANPGELTILSIVPKKMYPDYPDRLPTHRREIDLYPEFRNPRR